MRRGEAGVNEGGCAMPSPSDALLDLILSRSKDGRQGFALKLDEAPACAGVIGME